MLCIICQRSPHEASELACAGNVGRIVPTFRVRGTTSASAIASYIVRSLRISSCPGSRTSTSWYRPLHASMSPSCCYGDGIRRYVSTTLASQSICAQDPYTSVVYEVCRVAQSPTASSMRFVRFRNAFSVPFNDTATQCPIPCLSTTTSTFLVFSPFSISCYAEATASFIIRKNKASSLC